MIIKRLLITIMVISMFAMVGYCIPTGGVSNIIITTSESGAFSAVVFDADKAGPCPVGYYDILIPETVVLVEEKFKPHKLNEQQVCWIADFFKRHRNIKPGSENFRALSTFFGWALPLHFIEGPLIKSSDHYFVMEQAVEGYATQIDKWVRIPAKIIRMRIPMQWKLCLEDIYLPPGKAARPGESIPKYSPPPPCDQGSGTPQYFERKGQYFCLVNPEKRLPKTESEFTAYSGGSLWFVWIPSQNKWCPSEEPEPCDDLPGGPEGDYQNGHPDTAR